MSLSCHSEQAALAQRGIWASRAMAIERSVRGRLQIARLARFLIKAGCPTLIERFLRDRVGEEEIN